MPARRASRVLFSGLIVVLCLGPQIVSAQYGGPSILSRGGNQPGRRGRAPVSFTGYLGAGYHYETGLLQPVADANGHVAGVSDYGYNADWGLYGGHDWQKITTGLDYRGNYNWQANQQQFAGINHAVASDTVVQLTKRTALLIVGTGGTTNRAFGGFVAPAFADQDRYGVPIGELFDVRTYFMQFGVQASYSATARTSFNLGSDVFFVKRTHAGLTNEQGVSGHAGVRHRINRSDTIGAEFAYTVFEAPHAYARSVAQTITANWSRRVNRAVSVSASGGVVHIGVSGVAAIELSPEVAEILGRPTTNARFTSADLAPAGGFRAQYSMRRSSLFAGFSSGATGGNGVFVATRTVTANAGYSYAGIRRTSIGLSTGWYKTTSVGFDLGDITGFQAGIGGSYHLGEGANITMQLDYRTFSTPANSTSVTVTPSNLSARSGVAFSTTLSWSTSRLPLAIW